MLPFCDRTVSVARKDVAPVWTRSFPIAKEPTTLGEHLKKKRFLAGIRQSEAAQRLAVSKRTLSLWECDNVYPAWPQQPAVIAYLGYDPFTNPEFGRPKGNETKFVAILALTGPLSFGQQIRKRRLELKKNGSECAKELGVSVKTLRGWETDQCQPGALLWKRVTEFLQFDPTPESSRARPR
jgi:transcriptional regulator with XRE-family HTH domain